MSVTYLLALLSSIGGLALIDHRFSLVFWRDWRRAARTIGVSMAVFVIWDLLGIGLDIFRHGGSRFSLPWQIVPHFPVEEIFFLFLLCYVTLVLYLGFKRLWPRT